MGLFSRMLGSSNAEINTSGKIIYSSEFGRFEPELNILCQTLSMCTAVNMIYSYSKSIDGILSNVQEQFSSIDVNDEIQHYLFSEGRVYNGNIETLWVYDKVENNSDGFKALVFSLYPLRAGETDEEWKFLTRQMALFGVAIDKYSVDGCTTIGGPQMVSNGSLIFPDDKIANSFRKSVAKKSEYAPY